LDGNKEQEMGEMEKTLAEKGAETSGQLVIPSNCHFANHLKRQHHLSCLT
jgi:hypothetical protein